MRVLVADDHEEARLLVAEVVAQAGHEVTAVADGSEARRAAEAQEYDLAILDWMMPGVTGVDLCRWLRAERADRCLYIILLTVRSDEDDIVEGLDAGADGYLVKPVGVDEIRARVRAAERTVAAQRRLQQEYEGAAALAFTDELTGLLNRRGVFELLRAELTRDEDNGAALSILAVDVDGLKRVNDTFGHPAGDDVLLEVGRRIQGAVRGSGSAARLGGDEFAIILPGAGELPALVLAWRLLRAVGEVPFVAAGANVGSLTVSIGVAEARPGTRVQELLTQVDTALYLAKHAGGNSISTAPTPLP